MLAVTGLTVTRPTGIRVTVYAPVPLAASERAVIVNEPSAIPTTRPLDDTLATLSSLDDQVTGRPASVFPCASRTVAATCSAPHCTPDPALGATAPDAAGTAVTQPPDNGTTPCK